MIFISSDNGLGITVIYIALGMLHASLSASLFASLNTCLVVKFSSLPISHLILFIVTIAGQGIFLCGSKYALMVFESVWASILVMPMFGASFRPCSNTSNSMRYMDLNCEAPCVTGMTSPSSLLMAAPHPASLFCKVSSVLRTYVPTAGFSHLVIVFFFIGIFFWPEVRKPLKTWHLHPKKNTKTEVDMTCLDANHYTGAIIMLFGLPNAKAVQSTFFHCTIILVVQVLEK
ncbi:hypothetical protein ACHQM5_013380 [Ranunculus cassubicifolius]